MTALLKILKWIELNSNTATLLVLLAGFAVLILQHGAHDIGPVRPVDVLDRLERLEKDFRSFSAMKPSEVGEKVDHVVAEMTSLRDDLQSLRQDVLSLRKQN